MHYALQEKVCITKKIINTRKRYAGLDEAGNGQRKEDFSQEEGRFFYRRQ